MQSPNRERGSPASRLPADGWRWISDVRGELLTRLLHGQDFTFQNAGWQVHHAFLGEAVLSRDLGMAAQEDAELAAGVRRGDGSIDQGGADEVAQRFMRSAIKRS
jgi:hypothetical protein